MTYLSQLPECHQSSLREWIAGTNPYYQGIGHPYTFAGGEVLMGIWPPGYSRANALVLGEAATREEAAEIVAREIHTRNELEMERRP